MEDTYLFDYEGVQAEAWKGVIVFVYYVLNRLDRVIGASTPRASTLESPTYRSVDSWSIDS